MNDPIVDQMEMIRRVSISQTVERAVLAVSELDEVDLPVQYRDLVIAVIRGAGRDWED